MTRLSYDSRMNQENEVKATARGIAQKLAQGLEGLTKGLEGLSQLQGLESQSEQGQGSEQGSVQELTVSKVGAIPPLATGSTTAAHDNTIAQGSSSTARSSITIHSHSAAHAASRGLLLFDLVLPGDGAVVLATRGHVAIPVPPENPSLLPNPDLSEYRSPMSAGMFVEAGTRGKVDTEGDAEGDAEDDTPTSYSKKAIARRTIAFQGDGGGEAPDEGEEEKDKVGTGDGKDNDSDDEEEEEEEEGLHCELFAIASTYSPDSITIRAISGILCHTCTPYWIPRTPIHV